MVKIAPSFLSADFSRLTEEVKAVEEAGADLIHLDVMDGHFVDNISFGSMVVETIGNLTDLKLDVHLMITDPERYLDRFMHAGSDSITVHAEISGDVQGIIERIKDSGLSAGVAISPQTPTEAFSPFLSSIDLALIMSVEPGFGGQPFIPESVDKIKQLRAWIDREGFDTEIEVDGGIGVENAREVTEAGVDILVAGSSVFKRKGGPLRNIKAIREEAE